MNMAVWRTDPKLSGIANCIGDIGTHIENYVAYITGLKIRRVLATRDKFGKALELNANMIVEYDNGAHGVFCSSQRTMRATAISPASPLLALSSRSPTNIRWISKLSRNGMGT